MITWPRLYNTILAISVQIRHGEKSDAIGQNIRCVIIAGCVGPLSSLPPMGSLSPSPRSLTSPPLEDERSQECLPLYFHEDLRRLTEKAAVA